MGPDAANRIRDIEEGAELADVEVIQSSDRARDLYLNSLKSASEEILLIFPSDKCRPSPRKNRSNTVSKRTKRKG